MKNKLTTLLMIFILSHLFSCGLDEKYELITVRSDYSEKSNLDNWIYEKVIWQKESIKNKNGDVVIAQDTLNRKSVLTIEKAGEYKVTLKSIFGDSIEKWYNLNNQKRQGKIIYPTDFYQEITYKELSNELKNQKEFFVLSQSTGCFGPTRILRKFVKEIDKVKVTCTSPLNLPMYDTTKEDTISIEKYDEMINESFRIKKLDSPTDHRLLMSKFTIQFENKIFHLDTKEFYWVDPRGFSKKVSIK